MTQSHACPCSQSRCARAQFYQYAQFRGRIYGISPLPKERGRKSWACLSGHNRWNPSRAVPRDYPVRLLMGEWNHAATFIPAANDFRRSVGKLTQKLVATWGSDWKPICPPMPSASCLEIYNPRPAPWASREFDASALEKRSNIFPEKSDGIPGP